MTGTTTARPVAAPVHTDASGPRPRRRFAVALGAAVVLTATLAAAAVSRLGPDGGRARAILVDTTTAGRLWAATDGGVFTSADRGEHWTPAGLAHLHVRSLALLPTNPATLLAGTDDGVFRRDGGSWVASRDGLCTEEPPNCEDVVQLLGDPSSGLYAYAVLATGGLARSQDGGRHWNQITFPTSEPVKAMAISTANPPVLLAASPHGGLWRSTTRGGSWQDVTNRLTTSFHGAPRSFVPYAVAFDAARPLLAYVAGSYGACASADGGQSWTALAAPADRTYSAVAADPTRAGVLLLAESGHDVYRSANGGAGWTRTQGGLLCVPQQTGVAEYLSFAFERTGSTRAWALSPTDGLRVSDDGGLTWTRRAPGMTDARLNSVAVDPTDEWTVLVADARGALLKTTNAGATWTELAASFASGCPASPQPRRTNPRIAVHPLDPHFLVANLGTSGLSSSDGGASWRQIALDDPDPLAFDHFNPRRAMFAHDVTVYRTSDGGVTWPRISTAPAPVKALATTPANDATVAAAIDDLTGVAVSHNGGFVWELPTTPPPNTHGHAVAIDPNAPDTLYMAGDGGLARSADGGITWTPINAGLPHTCSTDPQGAVTCDGGPWVLAVDPNDGTVYAGGRLGLFSSANRGTSWTPADANLEGLEVTSLAFGPGGRVLFVGTANAGAVAFEVGDRTPRRRLHRR